MCATTVTNEPCCEKKRALLVLGSPHADGPTARLLAALETALPPGTIVDRFDCFAQPVLPCNDCRACRRLDRCVRPDLDGFYPLLERADFLVFATPVYNLSFPAPLKAVIDRMQRYWSARFIRGVRPPIAKKKQAVLLTAAGTDGPEGGELLERQLRPVLTILNASLAAAVHYTGADSGRGMAPSLERAANAGRMLHAPQNP